MNSGDCAGLGSCRTVSSEGLPGALSVLPAAGCLAAGAAAGLLPSVIG